MAITSGMLRAATKLEEMPAPEGASPLNEAAPRITIITPSHNSASYIAQAIESVVRQGYPNLEHIVVDARSTDGTIEVLKSYRHLRVVHEPDDGSHDAMNKGIRAATGEIIGFLNSDDLCPPGVLESVSRTFAQNAGIDLIAGHCLYFTEDAKGTRELFALRKHKINAGLWLPELMFGVVGINGCFFRRSFFEKIGELENSFDFAADRHIMLRAANAGVNHVWLDSPTICYRVHDRSRTLDPKMQNLIPISKDHFRMASEFALSERRDFTFHKAALAWRAFEGLKLVLRLAIRGEIQEASRLLWSLSRLQPLWLLNLPRALAMRRLTRVQDKADSAGATLLSYTPPIL